MTPERYRRLKEIFEGALALDGAERVAWLEAECGADREFRDEVERLLAADAESGWLERPAMEAAVLELARNQRDFRPGAVLGPFAIERLLGAGGMSQVYLALDQRSGERVALKLLPRALLFDPTRARRFTKETVILRSLAHPGIVAVKDAGEVNGSPYLAMQFVEGETLRQRLAAGAATEKERWRWASAIALAVGAAHKAGIVHRDLKPENIIIDRDGQPKVLDFGIARLMRPAGAPASATTLTRSGWLVGTVRYMSPEQAAGQPVDARSDVFSLGSLLHELWSGSPAFQGENELEVLDAVMNRAPAPLPKGAPAIIRQALEKNPALRPAHAGELARGLAPPRASLRPRRWWFVAAALILAFLVWFWPRSVVRWREGDRVRVSIPEDPALQTVVRTQLAQSPFFALGEPAAVVITGGSGWLEARRGADTLARINFREGALTEACLELRRELGESRTTLTRFAQTPERNLTSSREALMALARGDARRAVALDPEFALAWLEVDPARAYELRLRSSERDRWRITYAYHDQVTGDLEEAILMVEAWRQAFPRDPAAIDALESLYQTTGQKPRAGPPADWARALRECVPPPAGLRRAVLARSLPVMALCGQPDRAQLLLDGLRRDFPHDTRIRKIWGPVAQAAIHRARGQKAQMEQALASANDDAAEGAVTWLRSLR